MPYKKLKKFHIQASCCKSEDCEAFAEKFLVISTDLWEWRGSDCKNVSRIENGKERGAKDTEIKKNIPSTFVMHE